MRSQLVPLVLISNGQHRVEPYLLESQIEMAPGEGIEPPTRWLTATCSTD